LSRASDENLSSLADIAQPPCLVPTTTWDAAGPSKIDVVAEKNSVQEGGMEFLALDAS
jgi:hypothetical protein